jgi:hypothetical protein
MKAIQITIPLGDSKNAADGDIWERSSSSFGCPQK